ncbi:hypothetical protein, partial [Pseudomonas atacamensis]|uniref:hypothetical protein n=1 Tax=Pseudomonas atacamensis TaxID=2565368 RepID=UPI002B1DE849
FYDLKILATGEVFHTAEFQINAPEIKVGDILHDLVDPLCQFRRNVGYAIVENRPFAVIAGKNQINPFPRFGNGVQAVLQARGV